MNDRSMNGLNGNSHSQGEGLINGAQAEREFVDWKLAMTTFALLSVYCNVRGQKELQELEEQLLEVANERGPTALSGDRKQN